MEVVDIITRPPAKSKETINLKTHKDPVSVAFDLDDIQYRLHGAIHLVLHSYYGMTASGCEPDESDFDALYSLFRYLESLDKELSASIDELTDTIYATREKPAPEDT